MYIILTHTITHQVRRKWFLTELAALTWAEWQYPTAFATAPLWTIEFEDD